MTSERDIERLLDRWFTERPTDVADRVLDEVADRIGRQPQQPAWRVSWRDTPVNSFLKPLLAIAAVVAIAVTGFAILRPSGPSVAGPGATSPSPSPSPTPAPPELTSGPLEARDYIARAFPGDPMAFLITAPEGWTGAAEFFMSGPGRGSSAPDGVAISFNHDPQVVADPCGPNTEDPALRTPSLDDLVAALFAREDLQASGLTDTTLGGYSGKRLDLQFQDELGCANAYVFAEPKGLYANGPANRWRIWLLDVEGETAVVVLLDYAGTQAEDRAAAEAAIQSIRITP
jgi:hypothetical protein